MCAKVHRVLRPGRLFKFQVQGSYRAAQAEHDTWLGVAYFGERCRQNGEELWLQNVPI